jgi:hypothetical protein
MQTQAQICATKNNTQQAKVHGTTDNTQQEQMNAQKDIKANQIDEENRLLQLQQALQQLILMSQPVDEENMANMKLANAKISATSNETKNVRTINFEIEHSPGYAAQAQAQIPHEFRFIYKYPIEQDICKHKKPYSLFTINEHSDIVPILLPIPIDKNDFIAHMRKLLENKLVLYDIQSDPSAEGGLNLPHDEDIIKNLTKKQQNNKIFITDIMAIEDNYDSFMIKYIIFGIKIVYHRGVLVN